MHDGVIKWKHFPRYWPFVRGIHRSPVNSTHKGQWRGALMFSLIWINAWVNNREAGDLRRHSAHYDVIVMELTIWVTPWIWKLYMAITTLKFQALLFIYTYLLDWHMNEIYPDIPRKKLKYDNYPFVFMSNNIAVVLLSWVSAFTVTITLIVAIVLSLPSLYHD